MEIERIIKESLGETPEMNENLNERVMNAIASKKTKTGISLGKIAVALASLMLLLVIFNAANDNVIAKSFEKAINKLINTEDKEVNEAEELEREGKYIINAEIGEKGSWKLVESRNNIDISYEITVGEFSSVANIILGGAYSKEDCAWKIRKTFIERLQNQYLYLMDSSEKQALIDVLGSIAEKTDKNYVKQGVEMVLADLKENVPLLIYEDNIYSEEDEYRVVDRDWYVLYPENACFNDDVAIIEEVSMTESWKTRSFEVKRIRSLDNYRYEIIRVY